MGPGKEGELPHVVLLDQGEHEPHEADDVHGEADETVVADEKREALGAADQDPEVVHHGLAVEEIVGSDEEVPGKRSKPGQIVDLVDGVANVDDLGEALDLDAERLKSHK